MKHYSNRRTSGKPDSAENNAGIKRRERCVCFGRRLLGTFIENERSGLVLAWDRQRRLLGRFQNQREAVNAIGEAAWAAEERQARTAEALDWINRPDVEFVSGLSVDLVGGGRRR
jgi:hypothetical protein